MPRADRFPEHFDYCVRAREQGLDQVAEYIHKIVAERDRLREALHKIAEIEHEDIPKPTTPNEGYTWTVLAIAVGLAEQALKGEE